MRTERGFSLIEVLIGAGIFLFVVIGILPLFTRAISDNTAGADYTQLSNNTKSRAEELDRVPFNSTAVTLTGGNTLIKKEIWSKATGWIVAPATIPATAVWLRTTTIRQYGIGDIGPGDKLFDTPLASDASQDSVHLKEIEVRVQSAGSQLSATEIQNQSTVYSTFSNRRQTVMRLLRAF